ncbi:MAG: hypothetical protein HY454_02740 [Parcubacteria group bacterium]|nr:hypothetical protein [Parcubacteria group bacterium]
MKHRGSSKIKYEHHMIQGLRQLLEQIEPWDEIKSIIPGEIKPAKSHKPLSLGVKYNTPTGIKCLARSGSAVQEVFIVTSNPKAFKQHLENFQQTS